MQSALLSGKLGRTLRKLVLGLATALPFGLSAQPAHAYEVMPGYLQKLLDMSCAPSCLLCHTDPEGGEGTLKGVGALGFADNRGMGFFIQNLILTDPTGRLTLAEPSEADVKAMLDAMRLGPCPATDAGTPNGPCDSDGDTVIDVTELENDTDPDDSQADAALCIGPRYGCGAHVAPVVPPASGPYTGAWLLVLATGLMLARRRRT